MSNNANITANGKTYNVDELVDRMESGTLYEYLEPDLVDMTDSERTAYLEDFQDAILEIQEDYEEVIDGIDDDIDELDEESQASRIERYEDEIEELEDLIDTIDEDLYFAVEECVLKVGSKFVRTDEDVSYNPSLDLEDGETARITATGGNAGIFEDDEDEVLEDLDGDGFITYSDKELQEAGEDDARLSTDQNIFLNLEPEDTVQDISYSNGVMTLTVHNSAKDKTTHVEIGGIQDGVNVYFFSANENFISESQYKSLPKDIQKLMYFGDDPDSIYEHLNETADEDKLSFIGNYDEIIAEIPSVSSEYATTKGSAVDSYVEDGLSQLFGFLNDPSEMNSVDSIMGDFINSLSGLDSTLKSEILITLIMTLATKGGQSYFKTMLSNGVISQIESVFMEDVDVKLNTETEDWTVTGSNYLSTNEKVAIMVMENLSGYVGNYGGAGMLTTGFGEGEKNGIVMSLGGFMGYDGAAGTYRYFEAEWANEEDTKAALELYRSALNQISWASDNGDIDQCLSNMEAKAKVEEHAKENDSYVTGINNAIQKLEKDGFVTSGADGLYDEEGYEEAYTALEILQQIETLSIEEVAAQFKSYLQNDIPDNHDGDVAAGVVYFLYHSGAKGKDFLELLFSVQGIKGWIKNAIDGETITPRYATTWCDGKHALDILKEY